MEDLDVVVDTVTVLLERAFDRQGRCESISSANMRAVSSVSTDQRPAAAKHALAVATGRVRPLWVENRAVELVREAGSCWRRRSRRHMSRRER